MIWRKFRLVVVWIKELFFYVVVVKVRVATSLDFFSNSYWRCPEERYGLSSSDKAEAKATRACLRWVCWMKGWQFKEGSHFKEPTKGVAISLFRSWVSMICRKFRLVVVWIKELFFYVVVVEVRVAISFGFFSNFCWKCSKKRYGLSSSKLTRAYLRWVCWMKGWQLKCYNNCEKAHTRETNISKEVLAA